MATPESIKEHAHKYNNNAWRAYDIWELGMWVHLLTKRAEHRSNETKAEKDYTDAQNYLNMMQERLNETRGVLVDTADPNTTAQKVISEIKREIRRKPILGSRQLPTVVNSVLKQSMSLNTPYPIESVIKVLQSRVQSDRVSECSQANIMEILLRSSDFDTEKRDHNRVWVTRRN